MFNLNILDNNITVTGIDLNFDKVGSTTIELYSRIGGYEGFEDDQDGWELLSSLSLSTTNPVGIPTFADINDFQLLANTSYGIYLYSRNTSLSYTYNDNLYINSDVSLESGAGVGGFFGNRNDNNNGIYPERTFNGTIHYDIPEPSIFTIFTLGLVGLTLRRLKK